MPKTEFVDNTLALVRAGLREYAALLEQIERGELEPAGDAYTADELDHALAVRNRVTMAKGFCRRAAAVLEGGTTGAQIAAADEALQAGVVLTRARGQEILVTQQTAKSWAITAEGRTGDGDPYIVTLEDLDAHDLHALARVFSLAYAQALEAVRT